MTRAKVLLPAPSTLPRCGVEIRDPCAVRFRGARSLECGNAAKYEVEGVPLCGRHAGSAALKILLKEANP